MDLFRVKTNIADGSFQGFHVYRSVFFIAQYLFIKADQGIVAGCAGGRPTRRYTRFRGRTASS